MTLTALILVCAAFTHPEKWTQTTVEILSHAEEASSEELKDLPRMLALADSDNIPFATCMEEHLNENR